MKIITWVLGTILVLGIGTAIGLRLFAGDPNNPKAHVDTATVAAACARDVTYYANTAPKGSNQFGPDQSGHELKATSSRFQRKLCSDPLFAATTIAYAKNGVDLDAEKAEAQARQFVKHPKTWVHVVTAFLGQGNKTNQVKNSKYAVASYTVRYDDKSYRTLGMVPHGAKKMPTLVKAREDHKVGWTLVLHLKDGHVRELRIACDLQPVGHDFPKVKAAPTQKKAKAAPAPRHVKPTTPKITPVAHCEGKGCHPAPPPKHCTANGGNGGSNCSPPPGCKSNCKPPPKCTHNCGGPPPKCTKDCSPPPPKCPPGTTGKPPHCKTPPKKCPCVTKAQVNQPVQANNHVPIAAVKPTPGAPKQAPPVQAAKPVNNRPSNGTSATKAPDPTPNGSNSGHPDGSGTPSGSHTGGGHTSVNNGPGNGNGHVSNANGGNNATDGNGHSTGGGTVTNPFS